MAAARTGAVGAILVAALCFGTTGTAQSLGAASVDPLLLGSARIVLGGALLAALLGARAVRRRAPVRPTLPVLVLVLFGAVGVAAYQPAFFTGTAQNGVAVGTIVALGSAPAFTGLLEWLVLRAAPSPRWFVSTALAAGGVVLLSGGGADTGASPLGLAASAGAGASFAVYAVCGVLLLQRGLSPVAAMGAQFGAAALLALPFLLLGDASVLAGSVPAVLWLGVVTVAIAYTFFARGLRMLSAATVSTLTLLEPAIATLLGVAVLGERLTAGAVAGVVVVVAAVLLVAVPGRARRLTEDAGLP
ncbi:EamA family transporter [Rathayibacter tanaceti]|uniref:EamA family transporter n=2 Tax=Rathayibacter tanaceti TaxID=1671680 RepID=A0A162J0S6_9MICO|nr:EamA family transporter [Rathayibacter tanaceti]KZX20537.1 putative DMT superfamily transporter inner membrane protein [Rathayibacter tanaceti]QHC54667.1 EamA family transporter [Rathayibacter tanaceti]TCO37526.1 DME family drug/metabolite transporter [Rathayibacter tanaceti]